MNLGACQKGGLAVFALLSAADFTLTWYLVDRGGGSFYEANPLAAWCLSQGGWAGLAAFKVALAMTVAGLAVAVHARRPTAARGVLVFGCVALAAVVVYSASLAVSPADRQQAAIADELALDDRMNESFGRTDSYRAALYRLHDDLVAGRITLAKAAAQLAVTEKGADPDWLATLRGLFPGLDERRCLAASLVRFSLADLPGTSAEQLRLARHLTGQLYAFCGTDSPDVFPSIHQAMKMIEAEASVSVTRRDDGTPEAPRRTPRRFGPFGRATAARSAGRTRHSM